MILKCSAEPKHRYLAQNCYFDVKVEPVWLNDEACPNGKRSVFGIVQRRNSLKLQYLRAVYSYALRGVSYGITSRDFVCQSPNQNPPQKVDLLFEGLRPPIPRKGEICVGKDIRIAVRVTAKEKEKIQSKARKCGLSTTEYVKQRALGYEPRGIPPDALFLCLEKLGELADKASSPELDKEIGDVLKEITAAFLLPGKG